MLAQANARLLRVGRSAGTAEGGYTDDYDRDASLDASGDEGGDLWTGKAEAYWIERRQRNYGRTGEIAVERSVVLDAGRPELEWKEGDLLTVEHGGAEKRGTVQLVEKRAMPGVAPSVRLTLDPAGRDG